MLASVALLAVLRATPTPSATAPATATPTPAAATPTPAAATPAPSATTPMAAAPVPSPQPTDNPAVSKLAKDQFYAFAAGKVDASLYSMAIPTDVMPQVQAFLTALGPVKNVTLVETQKFDADTVYVYRFACQNGAALEQISLKDGKIDGIYFRPVQY